MGIKIPIQSIQKRTLLLFWITTTWFVVNASVAFIPASSSVSKRRAGKKLPLPFLKTSLFLSTQSPPSSEPKNDPSSSSSEKEEIQNVIIIGAGWGGLSAAYQLSTQSKHHRVTLIDAAPRIGGLVRDGFRTISGTRTAEAGQHGFWDNYFNIFRLLDTLGIKEEVLTGYAEQGQYSPNGLEAVWPVYRDRMPQFPTGLAQALYTKFLNLPLPDQISAFPLVLAFSEFDESSEAAYDKYDQISFRDLCIKLGVSRRCYDEAFEPMILTGLFAPGRECSAAAALGMAYFFVLKSQNSFDVRWCKGNVGEMMFDPWMKVMTEQENPVNFVPSTRVIGFRVEQIDQEKKKERITHVTCQNVDTQTEWKIPADRVVFAVGATSLNAFVRNSPALAKHDEFRRYANLRGTSVLATRLFLDVVIDIPYSANACWGFDENVGMTFFDITTLHGPNAKSTRGAGGSVIEVDYYHASDLLVMEEQDVIQKVKCDVDVILGPSCKNAKIVDAAIIKLPQAVNWYFPGSYRSLPDRKSNCFENVYYVGDLVKSKHGSWSQEKAYVTGMEAANLIMNKNDDQDGIIPLPKDELHVAFGKNAVKFGRKLFGENVSLVDFLW